MRGIVPLAMLAISIEQMLSRGVVELVRVVPVRPTTVHGWPSFQVAFFLVVACREQTPQARKAACASALAATPLF